jgi:hypothetical protein
MPGGVAGQPLTDGKARVDTKVDLAALRKTLAQSLAEYAREGNTFRKALPPIPLTKLSVVAFVQDDEDRTVLNAALASAGKAD